jgi:uncharacterized protein
LSSQSSQSSQLPESGDSGITEGQRRMRSKYGPWALVTGASDGIGRAIAMQLARSGLNLVLVARRHGVLEALAAELARQYRIEVRYLALDLGKSAAVDTIVSATAGLDVGLLAAIAGFGTSGRFVDGSLDRELDMVDVNCRAVVALSHHFSRRFAAQRRGGLILMSSLLAFQGVPRAANYAATKAFIQTFAEGLRLELSRCGVDVVSSAPGPVRSGFGARADMRMGSAASPEIVARQTLQALGRRTTVRPGFLSKFLEGSLLPLPRGLRSRIMAVVMGGMTRHQNGSKEQQGGGLA